MRRSRQKHLIQKPAAVLLLLALGVAFFVFRIYHKPAPGVETPVQAKAIPPPKTANRIAVIIDDAGYNMVPCKYLAEIPEPITISILPNLPYSKSIAYCAHNANKEVFLHLPMESHNPAEGYPEGYLIKETMSVDKITKVIDVAIASIPFVTGVNNHMGSQITENKKIMKLIFTELRTRGLFFVDSFVTDHSVCPEVAKEMNLAFAQRDVFLDNKNDRAYIENQFQKLAEEARAKGYALGIGHARGLTLQIFKEQAKILTQQGFKIVEVQKLLHQL